MGEVEVSTSPVPLRRFLALLFNCWWIPALTLLLGVAGSVMLLYLRAPTYVSRATMWETAKLRLPEGSLFSEDLQNYLGTQVELLKSAKLRQATLARLSPKVVPLNREGEPLPIKIDVTQAPRSSVFVVEASSADPAYCQAYLDALLNEYLDYKKTVLKTVSGDTLASISSQVVRAERELMKDHDALTSYERSNSLAVLQQESTVSGGYLARLKTQLSDLQLEERLLSAATNLARGTNYSVEWVQNLSTVTTPSAAPPPNDRQLAFRELEMLKIQRERLSKFLRPKHPKMVKLDAELARAEKLLDIYKRQSLEELAASHQAVRLKIANLLDVIKEYELTVAAANDRVAEAERLTRNVARSQAVYDRLAALLRNVDLSRNIDTETFSVLETASVAKRSYRRQLILSALSILGGLGFGVGIVGAIYLLDDRLSSSSEVTEKLGEIVVGQVPEIKKLGNGSLTHFLQLGDPEDGYAESFRSLRSALLFMANGAGHERPHVLLITSAVPHEGKSVIAASLARTLAQGGARVVLIDGDLRRGRLHQLVDLQPEPGLSELLRSPARLDQVLQRDSIQNFAFIARGEAMVNGGDFFLGSTFDQVVARLRNEFDFVVIDSSPVFAADDAATLAPKVDGTLFVVRSRFTGARLVREALELLYLRRAKILGLVFNRADSSARSYHYYKYAEYYPTGKTT